MSTSNIPSRLTDNSTITTIAELRAYIIGDQSLADGIRSDMASALASLAKALGRPAEMIPAEPGKLRAMLAGKTAAMVGHHSGRWKNIQSLASMALAHVGIVLVQGRIRQAPSAQWLSTLKLLQVGSETVEAGKHFHLWRFGRYCTLKQIEPHDVDDAVIELYQQDLEQRSLVSEPARCARDAARYWNAAAGAHAAWPQIRLAVPNNSRTYALPMERFPASLRQDIVAWTEWLSGTDPFVERDFKPLREISVASRLKELREYLAALVLKGVNPDDMVNLAAVVTPSMARIGLRFFWDRAGQKHSVHGHHVASMVLAIARHWAKLPKTDVEALRTMTHQLRPKTTGITPKNISRLRQLDQPEKLDALVMLPTRLLDEARRAGVATVQYARQVQTAVAIEFLLQVPLRIINLATLRVGVELICGPGKLMSLEIPVSQVKNDMPINARLPEHLVQLITIYIERYRPLLTIGSETWLFPGIQSAAPKTEDGLRTQMQKVLAERCGLEINPHLFRHIAAYFILKQNPDAHGQVQRVLGHKSLTSTMSYYSGLEGPAALEHYDNLVTGMREAAMVRRPRDYRTGSGK